MYWEQKNFKTYQPQKFLNQKRNSFIPILILCHVVQDVSSNLSCQVLGKYKGIGKTICTYAFSILVVSVDFYLDNNKIKFYTLFDVCDISRALYVYE